jgi:PAS domain S-box-containing protein
MYLHASPIYLSSFNPGEDSILIAADTPVEEMIAVSSDCDTTYLQAELQETLQQLNAEIAERAALELALSQAKQDLDKQVEARTALSKTNEMLRRAICDRVATEAQLLQTTSELQEIFQAFPDVYFRLDPEGKILSYHVGQASAFHFWADVYLGKLVQDVLPSNVNQQFQTAILQVHQTESIVAIEFTSSFFGGEKSFEARLLPSPPNQIIVIVRDITERKWAEQALQRAKEDLEIRVQERTTELSNTNERLLQEIIERQRIEEALRYRIEFEKLITSISTHFINLAPDQIDNGINQALAAIAKFTDVDRSYVFLFSESGTKMDNTHEWCAKGIEPQIEQLQDLRVELFPWAMEKLLCFETVHIPDVKVLPPYYPQQQLDTSLDIQSLIVVPIVCGGLLIGYLGFDSLKVAKTWSEDSIALLKMVGEMLANALERKRVEQALRISEERYARAINAGKVGIWEWNIQTNEIYIDANLKSMLSYTASETTNHFEHWLRSIHPDDVDRVKAEINAYLEGQTPKYEIEHRMRHQDGSYLWFLTRGTVVRDENGKACFIAGSDTDITDRKLAENQLKASLTEKEVLLKEIHHRVKNNLQVISSLLRLQAGYIKDQQALDIFQDSQNRVRAMALIHENLYQSHDLARIEFADYIRKLTNNLCRSYGVNYNQVKLNLNIEQIWLRVDTAIPCGLIINELVSNSLKHAFINAEAIGEIHIEFVSMQQNEFSLIIGDNGIGVPEDIEVRRHQSLGLRLVWNLVEQLEGSIAVKTKSGTFYHITFVELN